MHKPDTLLLVRTGTIGMGKPMHPIPMADTSRFPNLRVFISLFVFEFRVQIYDNFPR